MSDVLHELNGVRLEPRLDVDTAELVIGLPDGTEVRFPAGVVRVKAAGPDGAETWRYDGPPPEEYDEAPLRALASAAGTRNRRLVVEWLQLTTSLLALDLPDSPGKTDDAAC